MAFTVKSLDQRHIVTDILQSSLLSAIIGDMRRVDGELHVNGTISYAPQNPWYATYTFCYFLRSLLT